MAGVLDSGAQEYVELLITTSLQSYAPTSLPTSSFSPIHLESSRPNLYRTSEGRPIPPTRPPNDPPLLKQNWRHTVGNESWQVPDWNKVKDRKKHSGSSTLLY